MAFLLGLQVEVCLFLLPTECIMAFPPGLRVEVWLFLLPTECIMAFSLSLLLLWLFSRHLARLHTFSCYVQPVTHECASDARILDGTIIPEI